MTDTEKIQLAEDLYNDPSTTQKEKDLLEKLFPEIKPMYFLEIPAGDVAPAEEDGPLEEDIFPESSESEKQPMDEKIRQYLIQMVNAIRADDFELSGLNKEEVLAYLKKEKEQWPAGSEKLKAEIEKRLKNVRNYINGAGMKYKGPAFYKARGKESAYDALLSIINSLQQGQPEEMNEDFFFDEVLKVYDDNDKYPPRSEEELTMLEIIARHFYGLGINPKKKKSHEIHSCGKTAFRD